VFAEWLVERQRRLIRVVLNLKKVFGRVWVLNLFLLSLLLGLVSLHTGRFLGHFEGLFRLGTKDLWKFIDKDSFFLLISFFQVIIAIVGVLLQSVLISLFAGWITKEKICLKLSVCFSLS